MSLFPHLGKPWAIVSRSHKIQGFGVKSIIIFLIVSNLWLVRSRPVSILVRCYISVLSTVRPRSKRTDRVERAFWSRLYANRPSLLGFKHLSSTDSEHTVNEEVLSVSYGLVFTDYHQYTHPLPQVESTM